MSRTKVKEPPVKVFYARRSSNTSLFESQLALMRKKWGDLPVHTEEISGGKHRAVLMRLLRELPEGSTIYVAHVDRLSRAGIFDFLQIVEHARLRKISVFSLHDGEMDLLDENPLFLSIKAYIAEQERAATSRRMIDAIQERRKKYGGLWGGQLAKKKGTHKWGTKEVNPIFAQALPYLKELRAGGFSYEKITEMASEKFGQKFSKAHVHRLINGRNTKA